MKKIIVLVRDENLMKLLNLAFPQHLKRSDFKITADPQEAARLIVPGVDQLLITGALVSADEYSVAEFVGGLRTKNTKLVCVAYSAIKLKGDFDHVVEKRHGFNDIKGVIDLFLEGKLTRTEQKEVKI